MKHPIQPLEKKDGVLRFKQNAIVRHLLDHGKRHGCGLSMKLCDAGSKTMDEEPTKCPFCAGGKNIGEPAPGHTKHVCQWCGGTGQNQEARGSATPRDGASQTH